MKSFLSLGFQGSSNDYNKALMHFARCSDSKCASSSCQWMKGLILHSHECEQKSKGQCHDCQKAVAICILHSTKCEESNCPIHFCYNVKNTLRINFGKRLTLGQKISLAHFYQNPRDPPRAVLHYIKVYMYKITTKN